MTENSPGVLPDTFGCIGSSMVLSNGAFFDLVQPDYEVLSEEVIAAALSKLCRFSGQTPEFYSVAEHSVLAVAFAMEAGYGSYGREVLMHDAVEAVLGDMIRPLKLLLPEYSVLEQQIATGINERFGLRDDPEARQAIQVCDRLALRAEKRHFWPDQPDWPGMDDLPDIDISQTLLSILCLAPLDAEQWFMIAWGDLVEPSVPH